MGKREGGVEVMEVGEEGDYIPVTTLSPPEWLLPQLLKPEES